MRRPNVAIFTLVALFVASGIFIGWTLTKQLMNERIATVRTIDHVTLTKAEQAVKTKQQRIDELQKLVSNEKSEIRKLSKQPRPTSRGQTLADSQAKHWRPFTATFYAQGGINGNGRTATGAKVRDHWTVAVDPRVIPLGSVIEIRYPNGSTEKLKAEDTGGAIVGSRIDIYDSSPADCVRRGIEQVTVRVFVSGRVR